MTNSRLPLVIGDRSVLRSFEPSDAPFLAASYSDPGFQAAAFPTTTTPRSPEWFSRRLLDGHAAPLTNASGAFELAVATAEEPGRAIGVAGLYSVDRINGNAEMGVSIVEPRLRGRGLGREAHRLLLAYGFDHLGLDRIYGHIKADNLPALRLAQAVGFTVEGTLRGHRRRAGTPVDLVIVGILRDERDPATVAISFSR